MDFEDGVALLLLHGKPHNKKKELFDRKFDAIENEVAQNELDVIRLFFYACIDIELDFLALICSIVELCNSFMKATFLESFAEIMNSKMDKINKIQERYII